MITNIGKRDLVFLGTVRLLKCEDFYTYKPVCSGIYVSYISLAVKIRVNYQQALFEYYVHFGHQFKLQKC